MSSEDGKTHEVPVPSTSSAVLPTTPPKRFLTSPKKLLSSPLPSSLSNLSSSLRLQLQPPTAPPQRVVTPPKLTRFPTVLLTPVDITKLAGKGGVKSTPSLTANTLPPPPPLIKMPIATRKDKRSGVALPKAGITDDTESVEDDVTEKQLELPRKRTRIAEKSGENSSRAAEPNTTPRKIIQEIFGPDKSKRTKGKGRKKKRGGVVSPKKRNLAEEVSPGHKEDDGDQEEYLDDEGTEDKGDLEEIDETQHEDGDSDKLKAEDVMTREEEEEDEVKSDGDKDETEMHEGEEDDQEESCEIDEEGQGQDETESVASFSRRVSRRRAKVVANERLKRLSQSEEGGKKEGEEEEGEDTTNEDCEQSPPAEKKVESEAASVHSRRSTTEGSSLSGSSIAQQDSESSVGGEGNCNNKFEMDRHQYNPTPFSGISDDDDLKEEEDADMVSVGDMLDHKDSDVDSTYSWKPVRAAAAAALEQVTKNQGGSGQGSGSTGLPGDAEAKAAAAAERRARKINRYKGRNRRTLLFKSSSSKKYTAIRNNRYSAQPTIAPKVFHHGHYFQAGDIVHVELADGTPIHGQIRGLIMDHFGEISAGIRFLSAKHPIYAFMTFDPTNYAFRYDIPEKLIKIDFVHFVMHSNLDYFEGHPSYNKIEKQSLYTRMGKSLQKSYERDGSDISSNSSTYIDHSSGSDSCCEDDGNNKKDASDKGMTKDTRRRHISDSSTDVENDVKLETEELQGTGVDDEEEDEDGGSIHENDTTPAEIMEVDN